MEYQAIQVTQRGSVAMIRFQNGEKNCINERLILDMNRALDECVESSSVIVLEGNRQYFCYGADFAQISDRVDSGVETEANPAPLFDLWKRLAEAPCAVISHVQGAVNAGGMGFIGASDIVVAAEEAAFSLSELLFGLMPAMVLPFLIRRIGYAKTNYLTLTTRPVSCEQAERWGIVDIRSGSSETALRQLMARLSKTPRDGIERYKAYINRLCPIDDAMRAKAVAANLEVFGDERNLQRIADFTLHGKYPWE